MGTQVKGPKVGDSPWRMGVGVGSREKLDWELAGPSLEGDWGWVGQGWCIINEVEVIWGWLGWKQTVEQTNYLPKGSVHLGQYTFRRKGIEQDQYFTRE